MVNTKFTGPKKKIKLATNHEKHIAGIYERNYVLLKEHEYSLLVLTNTPETENFTGVKKIKLATKQQEHHSERPVNFTAYQDSSSLFCKF